jgi:hypothetical protein
MKKNFITKEYSSERVAGTHNMCESRTFFASKILEIDDVMLVDDNDIIWVESLDKTQGLGVDNENKSLDTNALKHTSHTFKHATSQSEAQVHEFPSWEITIDTHHIISEYLFAELKRNRTFAGISNKKTASGNIDTAIKEYVQHNIIPRIRFSHIDLYVKYYRIGEKQQDGSIALQSNNAFVESIITPTPLSGESTGQYTNRRIDHKKAMKVTNFQLTSNIDQSKITVNYKQIKNALQYKFDYYFDIVYIKA